jgi:hypothetical protein
MKLFESFQVLRVHNSYADLKANKSVGIEVGRIRIILGGACSVPKAEPCCKSCSERNCNYVL